jgi:hypothetical protein
MVIADVERRLNVKIDEHLIRDVEIPVHTGPQRQGDVVAIPCARKATMPLTLAGVAVVRGENGGNTHALHADRGDSFFNPNLGSGQILGWLTVAAGSVSILSHPEHGFMAFGPGSYEIRRQREMADEIRLVQD